MRSKGSTMIKHTIAASLLIVLAISGVAMADDDCNVSMNQWQSREAVQKSAEARGWKVSRIKIDDGCYQIRGIDETGQPFKAKIDPATLAVIKMKRKRTDDDHGRERRRSTAPGMIELPSSPPANGLFNTGESPKVIVR